MTPTPTTPARPRDPGARRALARLGMALAAVLTLLAGLLALPGAATAQTSFSGGVPRVTAEGGDAAAVTLGSQFTATKAGKVTGVRFYKGTGNGGVHVGGLYDPAGTLLAKATFSGESSSGWQKVTFGTAVTVKAGTTYTAAVLMPQGHYAHTQSYTWPHTVGDLTVRAGVYRYGSTLSRPTSTYLKTNYWIDVDFTASTTPTTPAPAPTSSPTTAPVGSAPSTGWPDASNTGTVGCPTLKKVDNGDEVQVRTDGAVIENTEYLNPVVINVRADNVKIRCVKFNGTGWFGVDNTSVPTTGLVVDRVDVSCRDAGQVIGFLVQEATLSRVNAHNCDHMANVGGDDVVIRDSYCHHLTDKEVVHADCIQSTGGNRRLLIEHNALWSRDTSDILLGQEGGDAQDVTINNNRLMSVGSPPPAYLLYVSGINTKVTNNRFTRRYTYGACTLNTKNPVVWSGNVWDDDGSPLKSCG